MKSLNALALRAYVWLQLFAAQEPVRLRAALTSALLALAVLFPALAADGVADKVTAVSVVVLPILFGESARRKVSPTGK
ncbi:hypothetical protein [Streptomyces sp. DH12]|uniref:hypothetical protein n=1 Tax=Streptomyces sp. DH12 TaxID=2857010 RepID=UPI001E632B19|nr:hypothetical protein [Streptomyces sp. DH12]